MSSVSHGVLEIPLRKLRSGRGLVEVAAKNPGPPLPRCLVAATVPPTHTSARRTPVGANSALLEAPISLTRRLADLRERVSVKTVRCRTPPTWHGLAHGTPAPWVVRSCSGLARSSPASRSCGPDDPNRASDRTATSRHHPHAHSRPTARQPQKRRASTPNVIGEFHGDNPTTPLGRPGDA